MLALLEINGLSNFDNLNDNIPAQIEMVYKIIDSDSEYQNMETFVKNFKESKSKITDKDKAETSVKIRDRGNKAYGQKDFETALLHFGQSALMGPIQNGQGREVSIALANRSAVHFEMEQW